ALPILPHLGQAFHEDRGAFAIFLAAHRLEQVQRFLQILLNRLRRRAEVQTADFSELVVRTEHLEGVVRGLVGHSNLRPWDSMWNSRTWASPVESAPSIAERFSGGPKQNRQPPPPAPQTLAAVAPAAFARAMRLSIVGVDTPGARRLRLSHSLSICRPTSSQSRCSSALRSAAAVSRIRSKQSKIDRKS